MTVRSSNNQWHQLGRLRGRARWRRKGQHWGWWSAAGPMDGVEAAAEKEDVTEGSSLSWSSRRNSRHVVLTFVLHQKNLYVASLSSVWTSGRIYGTAARVINFILFKKLLTHSLTQKLVLWNTAKLFPAMILCSLTDSRVGHCRLTHSYLLSGDRQPVLYYAIVIHRWWHCADVPLKTAHSLSHLTFHLPTLDEFRHFLMM